MNKAILFGGLLIVGAAWCFWNLGWRRKGIISNSQCAGRLASEGDGSAADSVNLRTRAGVRDRSTSSNAPPSVARSVWRLINADTDKVANLLKMIAGELNDHQKIDDVIEGYWDACFEKLDSQSIVDVCEGVDDPKLRERMYYFMFGYIAKDLKKSRQIVELLPPGETGMHKGPRYRGFNYYYTAALAKDLSNVSSVIEDFSSLKTDDDRHAASLGISGVLCGRVSRNEVERETMKEVVRSWGIDENSENLIVHFLDMP